MIAPDSRSGGRLLAFMGLPGSGKSTTAAALARLIRGSTLYLEPEEPSWPTAVMRRDVLGCFSAITWFRAMRVPQLYTAATDRRDGKFAIVDSYYDKLISYYIEHPHLKWLIPPTEPYLRVLKEMSAIDSQLLPDADCIIFLQVTLDQWKARLRQRGREMDSDALFLSSFPTQEAFLAASRTFSVNSGASLVLVDEGLDSPETTAIHIISQLRRLKLVEDAGS
ncbi:MAG TPA: hypothetical protein VJZ71_11045 [Phycisphaerae bacterium]|nr:hypothetical protein [Phycisphaerae bacterium]